MSTTKVMEKLKTVMNLNTYEAKVYHALLARGISSASELSEISVVPRSRCYDVLESLEKKGFVFLKLGKPIKYIPVNPEEVIDTLKKNARIEENTVTAILESIKGTELFEELQELYSSGVNYIGTEELTTSIVGRQNINLFLKEMITRAKNNVTVHTTKDGIKRKVKILKKALPKKIKANVHAPVEKYDVPASILINQKDTKMRFVKIDDNEMLVFTTPEGVEDEHEAALWIRSKHAIDMLNSLTE